ncbi:hypothetical protein M0R45_004227 [Rubus argutus]|uniref:BZIP domain-containing protein n=1 Tax=Rubus argutus TaxID=59490 RepID=A0AAW1YJ75_RUBAR
MGTGEEGTPSKPSKQASTAQEIPTQPSYPDWSSSMQAYYGAGAAPPPFFASTVASPTPHPYMWGAQHPMMPPYGTPVPYPAMYPPGGVYAHPVPPTNSELEGKGTDGKERAPAKKPKGTAGNTGLVSGKGGESGKATSGSGNDGASQRSVRGSDGSSDGSEENGNHQEYGANKKGSFDKMLAEGANAQNNTALVPGKPVVSMPATSLNMGMDLWNASPAGTGTAKMRGNQSGAPSAVGGDHWIQDERELKRQKRKQSNRESARRSRLRKQAECEELQKSVQGLTNENHGLKDELQRLSQECEKLASENTSIKEELTRLCGPDLVANIEQQSHGGEGNS